VDVAVEGMTSGINLAANGHVEFVQQHRVSARFFSVLGVQPLLGREFTPEEDRAGGQAAVLLSYTLWMRVFQGDPQLLGKPVMLRGETYTVVGVMPPNFQPPVPADVWTPLRPSRTGEGSGANYGVIARLRPGVTWAQAQAGLEPLSRQAAVAHEMPPNVTARLGLMPLQ